MNLRLDCQSWWDQVFTAAMGVRFLIILVVVQHTLKGLVAGGGGGGCIGMPQLYFYSDLGAASQMQMFSAAANTPWSLKPLIGLMSDFEKSITF